MKTILAALAFLFVASPVFAQEQAPPVKPDNGDLTIETAAGKQFHFKVELALTPEQQEYNWNARIFQDRQQNLTMACEIPTLIEQRAYDLIISDLQMPNLDGPGLYIALRKRFGEALPRVIFVTGHAEADRFVPFLAETGDPVLTKPFSVEDLRTKITILRSSE